MGALAVPFTPVDDYLDLIRTSRERYEYWEGVVTPVAGATPNHGTIHVNTGACLHRQLRGSPCRAFAGVSLRVRATAYSVPDIVVCGKQVSTDGTGLVLTNPKVIVEILSPSTAGFDYSVKSKAYRELPSVDEYILIEQDSPEVEVFRRTGEHWVIESYRGLDATVEVRSLGVQLPLADLYEGVAFAKEKPRSRRGAKASITASPRPS